MGFSMNKLEGNATEQLALYTKNLKYEDIPKEVVERAKMVNLHAIAAALAASYTPMSERAIELGKQFNGGPGGESTLWIDGTKVSMVNAAFTNAALTDMLDWEDCAWTGHPSAGAIPVSWAVGEAMHKSGKDLITAIVAAYDVYQRVAMVVQPPKGWDYFKGWGLTTWQIFACSTPAAKLMDLNVDQINQAFGISAVCTPIPSVLHHSTMSDAYHYEHGFRAKDGVMAAMVAKSGIENFMDAFDDPYCFHYHLTSDPKPEWYTKELGKTHYIMNTLCKHWPANMWVQTPIEITYNLVTENNLTPEDIKEVILDPPTQGRMTVREDGYTSITQAQFSVPFALASVICDPRPGPQWYSPERLKDPKVLSIAAKVKGGTGKDHKLEESFGLFKAGSHPRKTVTIITNDGRVLSASMDCHPGHPSNMMTREEFCDRFRIQASYVLDSEKIEKAIKILCDLENVDDVSQVSDIFHR